MNCIKCGNHKLICLDSRKCGQFIKRGKKCNKCKEKFTTLEIPVEILLKKISLGLKKHTNGLIENVIKDLGFYNKKSKAQRSAKPNR